MGRVNRGQPRQGLDPGRPPAGGVPGDGECWRRGIAEPRLGQADATDDVAGVGVGRLARVGLGGGRIGHRRRAAAGDEAAAADCHPRVVEQVHRTRGRRATGRRGNLHRRLGGVAPARAGNPHTGRHAAAGDLKHATGLLDPTAAGKRHLVDRLWVVAAATVALADDHAGAVAGAGIADGDG